jgi:hypothetical protein
MTPQPRKRLALAAAFIVPILAVSSALADGNRKFKMSFAGGFVQNILQLQVDAMGMPTGEVERRSMAFIKAQGTFGRADLMAVSFGGPPISNQSCSGGLVKVADIVEDNLLLTFDDLSLLYGNGTGVVCLDPADPTAFPLAEIDGTWDGGTGRFEGVGGSWSLRFDVSEPVGIATQFIAETGVLTGHLTRPNDDD